MSRLFKYEWIYEERAEFDNVFERTLSFFERCGWVSTEDDHVQIGGPFPVELHFFRRMILSFLESYAIVAGEVGEIDGETFERAEIVDRALERGKHDYLRGRILYHESISKPTFKNAVRLFEDWGLLERISEPEDEALRYRFVGETNEGTAFEELRRHLDNLVYGERIVRAPQIHDDRAN